MNNLFRKFFKVLFLSSLFTSPTFAETDFTISVENIIEEFESNSIVAEEKFLKKKITLTYGEISSVDDSLISDNFVYVIIKPRGDEYSFRSVLCSHKRNETIIRILRKGMEVSVTGILDSESTGLSFRNCSYKSYALTQKSRSLLTEGKNKAERTDHAGAISDYTKAIEMNPQSHQAYFSRGYSKSEFLDYAGAISDYTKAIEIYPQSHQAYFFRGFAKGKLKDHAGAISDYTKAIEIYPQFHQAYFSRSIAKYKIDKKDDACKDYKTAISLGSTGSNFFNDLCFQKQ